MTKAPQSQSTTQTTIRAATDRSAETTQAPTSKPAQGTAQRRGRAANEATLPPGQGAQSDKPRAAKPRPAAQAGKPAGPGHQPPARPNAGKPGAAKRSGAGTQPARQGGAPSGPKPDQPKAAPQLHHTAPPRMASSARMKRRHWAVLASLLVGVVMPVLLIGWYLWDRAADQYASTVAFSVRKEENSSALELLGGITSLSGSSSSDTDILYEFLQSQKLVSDIDAQVDLRRIWSQPLDSDPWFAFDPDGSIEDLVSHWDRMVKIYYDDGAGLIEVRALAFDPEDARAITQTLYDLSSQMINDLSAIAREDAIRYARQDLEEALDQLKAAREAVTLFRNANQLVDPSVDLQTQAGLLGNLEGQLADALIEYDLLTLSTRADDPRVTQAERRIEVIRDRIAAERRKLGLAGGGEGAEDDVYANLFGEYERLVVDREFAEASYTSARAAYDSALADARRQSRYLAAYVRPTLAETSRFPERGVLLGLAALLILLLWGTMILVFYALKDRR